MNPSEGFAPKVVRLWEGPAPEAKGAGPEDIPTLAIYPATASLANGASFVVCPGGGYNIIMQDHEGTQVARWLNRLGVSAFVLTYRTKPRGYPKTVACLDAQRAVRYVRRHAAEYGIAKDRIGMIGFSAGADLVCQVALKGDPGQATADDPLDRENCLPDRLFVIYGRPFLGEDVVMSDVNWDELAARMPPAFFMLASDDARWATEASFLLCQAMRRADKDAEYHLFGGYGPHGVGLAQGHPAMALWPELAARWMRDGGFLTGEARVPVKGRISIDGEPLRWGWVTFIPRAEAPNLPRATAMVNKPDGAFEIPATRGPAPGEYRIEVWQVVKTVDRLNPSMSDAVRFDRDKPDGPVLETTLGKDGAYLRIDIRTGPAR